MHDDLSEELQRLEFCRLKSAELQANIANLAGFSVSHWLQQDRSGLGEVRAKLLAQPPVSIRQEVGMIVNEQRAVLDALACKLARRNGANDTSDVSFPITATKAKFNNRSGRSKIAKLSVADQFAIGAIRPWGPSEEDPEDCNELLWQLHEGDIVRKHRHLLRWACLGGAYPISGRVGMMQSMPVVFNDIGVEVTLTRFFEFVGQIGVSFELVYVEPGVLDGHSVGPLLDAFNAKVAEIVNCFR